MDLQIQSSSFVLCPLCNRFINTKTVHLVVSEKFKLVANRHNIKTICKTRHTLRTQLWESDQ